eukprot:scaffold1557_cov246-Pinguiococcus_pyrenoidosus.AAC.12
MSKAGCSSSCLRSSATRRWGPQVTPLLSRDTAAAAAPDAKRPLALPAPTRPCCLTAHLLLLSLTLAPSSAASLQARPAGLWRARRLRRKAFATCHDASSLEALGELWPMPGSSAIRAYRPPLLRVRT